MKKRLYGAALALVIFIGALMLGGCLTTTSPEEAEDNMHDLLDNYTDVNELRTVWKNRTAVRRVYEKRATPLVAAIILDPGRVPVLIDKGANPSGVQGQTISPLQCAINADRCRRTFFMDKNIKRDDIFVIRHLLENGENPNSRQGLVSYLICSYYSSDLTEKLINKAKLLVEYEAKFTDMDLRECDVVARTTGVSEKRVQLIKDIRRHGVKESLNLWSKPDEYFEVSVAREKEEKERKK